MSKNFKELVGIGVRLSLACPKCQGEMRIIAFITDSPVVDRIINHLKLTFPAERLPPLQVVSQELLTTAEAGAEYFS